MTELLIVLEQLSKIVNQIEMIQQVEVMLGFVFKQLSEAMDYFQQQSLFEVVRTG